MASSKIYALLGLLALGGYYVVKNMGGTGTKIYVPLIEGGTPLGIFQSYEANPANAQPVLQDDGTPLPGSVLLAYDMTNGYYKINQAVANAAYKIGTVSGQPVNRVASWLTADEEEE